MSSHMPNISGEESHVLKKAALVLKQYIRLGEEFTTGQSSISEGKVTISAEIEKPPIIPADPNRPVLKCI